MIMLFQNIFRIAGLLVLLVAVAFTCNAANQVTNFLESGGPMQTTNNEIKMVQPNGRTERDYEYSQSNKNNSEANLNNAKADAVTIVSQAQATQIIASTCEDNPYQEHCMPKSNNNGGLIILGIAGILCGSLVVMFFRATRK